MANPPRDENGGSDTERERERERKREIEIEGLGYHGTVVSRPGSEILW